MTAEQIEEGKRLKMAVIESMQEQNRKYQERRERVLSADMLRDRALALVAFCMFGFGVLFGMLLALAIAMTALSK